MMIRKNSLVSCEGCREFSCWILPGVFPFALRLSLDLDLFLLPTDSTTNDDDVYERRETIPTQDFRIFLPPDESWKFIEVRDGLLV
jgi:hypothetical protein